jgi:replication factor A2
MIANQGEISSERPDGFEIGSSQGSTGKGGGLKNDDRQTIQPCTVIMLLRAHVVSKTDNSIQLEDGRKIHLVSFVGAILKYEEYQTNVMYTIEDGTGIIMVKQNVDLHDSADKLKMRQICMTKQLYVTIVALPTIYDGKIQLIVESIRPIKSGNELSCHLLDVVYVGEKIKNRGMIVLPEASLQTHLSIQKPEGIDIRDAVEHFIRVEGDKSDAGVEISKCVVLLGATYGEDAVRVIVGELASEGLIYSTTTEECYKFIMHC